MAETKNTTETQNPKRILQGISGLRALAALGIVLYHLNQHRSTHGLATWDWNVYLLTALAPIIVSFFFVLGWALHSLGYWKIIFTRKPSGSTSVESLLPSLKKTLIDRFFRIAPAYYSALIVTFIFVCVLQGVHLIDFWRLLSGLTFLSWTNPYSFFPVDINGPLWYISVDIMGGLLVLAVMRTLVRVQKKYIAPVFLGFAGLLLLGHVGFTAIPFPQIDGVVSAWFPWYNPFVFGLHFMVGMLLGAHWAKQEIKGSDNHALQDILFWIVLIGFFAFLWTIKNDGIFDGSYPKSPYHFPFVAIGIALILATVVRTKYAWRMLDNQVFSWIAGISYSLYLWHALVVDLLRRFVFGNEDLEIWKWWLLVIITFALAIPVAAFSEKYIEKKSLIWKKKNLG